MRMTLVQRVRLLAALALDRHHAHYIFVCHSCKSQQLVALPWWDTKTQEPMPKIGVAARECFDCAIERRARQTGQPVTCDERKIECPDCGFLGTGRCWCAGSIQPSVFSIRPKPEGL